MKNSSIENVKKFVLPMSLVVAASLGGVLLMGGQTAAPVSAATEAPRLVPAAEVASFKPFADDTTYKPYVNAPAAQNVYVTVNQAPVSAPATATPVYGNITNELRPVYEPSVRDAAKTNLAVAPLALAPQTTSPTGTINAGDDATITANSATITVGSAVINVLSSFQLNYGGKTVLGQNGQVTTTP